MTIVERLTTADVRFEIDANIAVITITRSAQGNSIMPRMANTFREIWSEVRNNPEIRVAVITAEGERHFCTGADVGELKTGDNLEVGMASGPFDQTVTLSAHQNRIWKPVVCAVNGTVVGGGLHFVVDSDIVVASSNAVFFDTHVNVGQVGAIENIGLTKRLPLGTALRMTLQGRTFKLPAQRAYQLGLVDELVDTPAEVLPMALEIAQEIAKNSPNALALSKEAIWKSLETGYTPSLEYGWSLLRMHWSHPDFSEGPAAFGEKRQPLWNPNPSARR
ncbi:enoyl-CoA hydratase/isomerase family protein [Pseudomonas fluorescens]|nr:enoyl-CoA hydratase/isomerase family protein [Pseudomonas fluorescens]